MQFQYQFDGFWMVRVLGERQSMSRKGQAKLNYKIDTDEKRMQCAQEQGMAKKPIQFNCTLYFAML